MTTKKDLESTLKIQSEKLTQLLQAAEIALDLADYTPHVQKLNEIMALIGGDIKSYPQAVAKWKESHAIKAKAERPLPGLVPKAGAIAQIPDIDGQPIDEEITSAWGDVAIEEAQAVTSEYSGAPFDGIYEAASEASDPAKIEQLKNYGKSLFYGALQKEMSNPAMIAKVKEEMKKKHRRA
jgi:hypothetical protein